MQNLLLVIGDSLRYDDGMQSFDWLRDAGLSYSNVWSHGAATYPAFPSLWTGLEVNEHGCVQAPLIPKAPGIDVRLKEAGYNVHVFTENLYTNWIGKLVNSEPHEHGVTLVDIVELDLVEPWAVIYHSMVPHWPYKFHLSDLPVGWPAEHPEVEPERYHFAYQEGVELFAGQVRELINTIRPDVTILTSDHGEAFGEHGQFLHAPWMHYPEQLHVPLIVADGKRRRTDRGLLGLKRLGDVVMAAAEGKRIRARDEYVLAEDYHDEMISTLLSPGGWMYKHGGVYDLSNDPDCTEFVATFPNPEHERIAPPVQVENATDPGVDLGDERIRERLRKLGYL